MKIYNHVITFAGSALMLAACETTIPASDSIDPKVTVSAIESGPPRIVTSSDESVVIEGVNCPDGRALIFDVFALQSDFPAKFFVTVADDGGVALAEGRVTGGAISNASEGVVVSSRTVDGNVIAIARKTFSRDDPRTAQIITFDVTPAAGTDRGGPRTVTIDAYGRDFAGNQTYTRNPFVGSVEALCAADF